MEDALIVDRFSALYTLKIRLGYLKLNKEGAKATTNKSVLVQKIDIHFAHSTFSQVFITDFEPQHFKWDSFS